MQGEGKVDLHAGLQWKKAISERLCKRNGGLLRSGLEVSGAADVHRVQRHAAQQQHSTNAQRRPIEEGTRACTSRTPSAPGKIPLNNDPVPAHVLHCQCPSEIFMHQQCHNDNLHLMAILRGPN